MMRNSDTDFIIEHADAKLENKFITPWNKNKLKRILLAIDNNINIKCPSFGYHKILFLVYNEKLLINS